MSTPNFLTAALGYFQKGVMTMPLTLDSAGFPKKPIVMDWSNLERDEDVLRSLPWQNAKGIGIVLGKASSNLAAIDIDSVPLTETLLAMLKGVRQPRIIRTARNRSHLYLIEESPSPSSRMDLRWDGEPVTIELKAQGTQVAAPPTPGYRVALSGEPQAERSVKGAWDILAFILEKKQPGRLELINARAPANYPTPWQGNVGKEFRNKSLYIEAHKLREARVAYPDALEILLIRVERHYEAGDFSPNEVTRTVQSAYRKGVAPDANAGELSDGIEVLRPRSELDKEIGYGDRDHL